MICMKKPFQLRKKYLQKTVNGTVNSTLNEGWDGNISN